MMQKLSILSAFIVVLGSLNAYEIAANFTLGTAINETSLVAGLNETPPQETVNRTISQAGPVVVNALQQDWVAALGTLISNVVNWLVGSRVLEAGLAAALIGILVLWMAASKLDGFFRWLSGIVGALFLIGAVYLLLTRLGLI